MLAACMDLRSALTAPHPEAHLSSVAVHQDGSCNGLQHYAALGRDARGGAAVNLAPADRPQARLSSLGPDTGSVSRCDMRRRREHAVPRHRCRSTRSRLDEWCHCVTMPTLRSVS